MFANEDKKKISKNNKKTTKMKAKKTSLMEASERLRDGTPSVEKSQFAPCAKPITSHNGP